MLKKRSLFKSNVKTITNFGSQMVDEPPTHGNLSPPGSDNPHQEELNIKLVNAAENGDLRTVQDCLNAGAEVNARFNGITALHAASIEGRLEIAKKLINSGADLNAEDVLPPFYRPLHFAILHKKFEIADLLIDQGALIDTDQLKLAVSKMQRRKSAESAQR